ncbi:MAG: VanZ family protein [Oscillospiraceae bacterium]|nr:VanZ family protein [Oscillospiraceae bacterium]
MIRITFLCGELALAGVWLLLRLAVWLRQGRIDWRREAVLLLMYVNLAVILRFTFYPMTRVGGKVQPLLFHAGMAYPFRINWIPFVDFGFYQSKRVVVLNVIGNVAMFIPSGIVLPIVYRKLDGFWKALGAGFLLSLCIELLQLPFFVRATDVDDLILNTLGVAVGYGIYAMLRRARARAPQKTESEE